MHLIHPRPLNHRLLLRNSTMWHLTIPAILFAPLALGQSAPVSPISGATSHDPISWVDLNGDGREDIVHLSDDGVLQILEARNEQGFESVTEELGLAGIQGATRVLWNDFDQDGDLDLLVLMQVGASRLYRHLDAGHYERANEMLGLDLEGVLDAQWLDFDSDGHIDLSLVTPAGHKLFKNRGLLGFRAVQLGAVPPVSGAGTGGPAVASGRLSLVGGSQGMSASSCAPGIEDFFNPSNCIKASSLPIPGMLYPVGSEWTVSSSMGYVGIGMTTPSSQLDVNGVIRSSLGGFEFPDGSLQTTAALQGLAGPAGPQGPTGDDGSIGPEGPTGAQGPDGADGAQGPRGTRGADGPAGPVGSAGTTGSAGPQGSTGSPGVGFAGTYTPSIGAGSVSPESSGGGVFFGYTNGSGGSYMNNGGDSKLIAAVQLPHGAIVSSIKVHGHDSHSNKNLRVTIRSRNLHQSSANSHLSSLSSGSGGVYSIQHASNFTINNEDRHYYLEAYPENGNGNWLTGGDLAIKAVVFTYTF